MAPGILRDVGDISHLAALVSPRRLVIAGGIDGKSQALSEKELKSNYAWTNAVFQLNESSGNLHLLSEPDPKAIASSLSG